MNAITERILNFWTFTNSFRFVKKRRWMTILTSDVFSQNRDHASPWKDQMYSCSPLFSPHQLTMTIALYAQRIRLHLAPMWNWDQEREDLNRDFSNSHKIQSYVPGKLSFVKDIPCRLENVAKMKQRRRMQVVDGGGKRRIALVCVVDH